MSCPPTRCVLSALLKRSQISQMDLQRLFKCPIPFGTCISIVGSVGMINMHMYNIYRRGSRTRDDSERFLNSKLDWRASLAAGTKHGLKNIEFEVADLRNSSFSSTFHCKLVGNWCTTCGKLNFYMYAMQYFPSTSKKRPKKHLALGEVLTFNPWTEKIMANIWKLHNSFGDIRRQRQLWKESIPSNVACWFRRF